MNKVLNLLGLAARAREIIVGEEFCLKAMSKHPKGVAFLANDAGNNIKKKMNDKAHTFEYTVINTYSTEELSKAIGKKNRKIVVVTNEGFNRKFREYLTY